MSLIICILSFLKRILQGAKGMIIKKRRLMNPNIMTGRALVTVENLKMTNWHAKHIINTNELTANNLYI